MTSQARLDIFLLQGCHEGCSLNTNILPSTLQMSCPPIDMVHFVPHVAAPGIANMLQPDPALANRLLAAQLQQSTEFQSGDMNRAGRPCGNRRPGGGARSCPSAGPHPHPTASAGAAALGSRGGPGPHLYAQRPCCSSPPPPPPVACPLWCSAAQPPEPLPPLHAPLSQSPAQHSSNSSISLSLRMKVEEDHKRAKGISGAVAAAHMRGVLCNMSALPSLPACAGHACSCSSINKSLVQHRALQLHGSMSADLKARAPVAQPLSEPDHAQLVLGGCVCRAGQDRET